MKKNIKIDFNTRPATTIDILQVGLLLFKWAGFINWPYWAIFIPTWFTLIVLAVVFLVVKKRVKI